MAVWGCTAVSLLLVALCQGAPTEVVQKETSDDIFKFVPEALELYDTGKGNIYDYMDIILAPEVGLQTLPNSTKIPDGSLSREKRVAILATLAAVAPIASAVFGAGSFIYGIINGQQRLAELREINRKLDRLDRKLDQLQQQLGDVQFGQQWLEGAVLYGRDIQRLNYFINYLDNNLNLGSNGRLVPANQANNWANAVLHLGSDGVGQVLLNLNDMMMDTSGIFGRNSLFVLYESRLDQDSDDYWPKVRQFLEFAFSIQTAGYASWATALNIKGRQGEVAAVVARGRRGLDAQRQFLQRFTKQWPTGTYGLPRTNTGCPVAAGARWRTGVRKHDTEDDDASNQWTNGLHFDGEFGRNNMKQKFCMKTSSGDGDGNWPRGSYCIFKKGGCPRGFQSGEIYWDDEDDDNGNSRSGEVPDGNYDRNTLIKYCCRNDGSANNQISLPNRSPFYLFRYRQGCQKVAGMNVREEFFRWDDEDDDNKNRRRGAHPYDDGGNSNHRLHYCYYS
uniref:Apextrin-like protein 1 n=1 Tax=Branchiostoma japonicum TaxID=373177 RepID=A0A089Q8Z4_9BRAN|nr:apextrin-like protein 1 [Branchiostoma japonicum]